MNILDSQYQLLLRKILSDGVEKKDRTGTGTISIFGQQIRHNMSHGFPLLTTKKMAIKTLMTELKWFLKGDTNIKYLVDNDCHIWDGDAYKRYINVYDIESREGGYGLEELHLLSDLTKEEFIKRIKTDDKFAKKWGELGPIYGKQWRGWKRPSTREEKIIEPGIYHKYIDQITNLINDLKTNPDSRRLMVNAWNVGEMNDMVLPPCHYGFQVYTRELNKFERSRYWGIPKGQHFLDDVLDKYNIPKRAISLSWNQRSVDTFLGLPFNIASYGMLLTLIAKEVNMVPEELIGNLGDTHLYLNHVDQAREQISREPMPHLPKLKLSNVDILNGEFDYEILHYHSHPAIKAPLSN
jgi:thymidylate synthase